MTWRSAVHGLLSRRPAGEMTTSPLAEVIKMPAHVVYVHWAFTAPVATLEWDLTIHADPGSSVGEYLALFNGSIDGAQCYLGLQTNISNPVNGQGIGKGLIFSTWWSFDAADTRLGTNGFREMGTHEGKFIGVRRPYPWTVGDYRVTLSRSDSEVVGARTMDWFDLSIVPLQAAEDGGARPEPSGPSEWIGALRFPRRSRGRPAAIDGNGLLFAEVYGGAQTWADVPAWRVEVMAFGDGARCPSGRTEYPRYPFAQEMPNTNARYNPSWDRIELAIGAGVERRDSPSRWP